ncbi:MAG: hypothetical protein WA843_02045, partial [Candidatus Saccharimonadales bacterium]
GRYVTGPGATGLIQGAEQIAADGSTTLATPGVVFRPPSDVSPTVESIEEFRAEILLEANQGHILGTDIIASGISRVQARADFETSLGDSAAALNPAGRWLIETASALAQSFANDAEIGDVAELRADFTVQIDTGPDDPTEVTNALAAVKDGVASREFGMQALGIEDTDAERAKINSEPGKDSAIRLAKAANLKAYLDAGLSAKMAAKLAGFEQDEIDEIGQDMLDNPVPAPAPAGVKIDPETGKPLIDKTTGQPITEPAAPSPEPAPAVPAAPAAA